jgi:hypothetical protein
VHKNKRSWLGLPTPRVSQEPEETSTICDLVSDDDKIRATDWIRTAIRNRQFSPTDLQNGFPRLVWHKDDVGQYWRGRLTDSGAGERPIAKYKGWPISEDEISEDEKT